MGEEHLAASFGFLLRNLDSLFFRIRDHVSFILDFQCSAQGLTC
jgi:hypothetical protein